MLRETDRKTGSDEAPQWRLPRRSAWWLLGGVLLVALAAFAATRYLPPSVTSPQHIARLLRSLQDHPLAWLYVCGTFALLASAFVPVTALITSVGLVFEPLQAFAYALSGALLSAALSRGLGQAISKPVQRRMSDPRLSRFRKRLHDHTFSATVAARFLPVGNFAAINMLAGALAVPWSEFMLGNLVGMSFGVAGLTLLSGRLSALVAAPTPRNLALFVALLTGVLGVGFAITRFVRQRERAQREKASE